MTRIIGAGGGGGGKGGGGGSKVFQQKRMTRCNPHSLQLSLTCYLKAKSKD
jgi:hypothetical protein